MGARPARLLLLLLTRTSSAEGLGWDSGLSRLRRWLCCLWCVCRCEEARAGVWEGRSTSLCSCRSPLADFKRGQHTLSWEQSMGSVVLLVDCSWALLLAHTHIVLALCVSMCATSSLWSPAHPPAVPPGRLLASPFTPATRAPRRNHRCCTEGTNGRVRRGGRPSTRGGRQAWNRAPHVNTIDNHRPNA